jgi:hypothetical protein
MKLVCLKSESSHVKSCNSLYQIRGVAVDEAFHKAVSKTERHF